MRTTSSLFRFPLHSWFVAVAVGAIVSSFALDVLFAWDRDLAWWRASFVVTALGALMLLLGMVPGFIDYFADVPRRGEVWKHANVHALFGLSLVGYFIASAGARWQTLPEPEPSGALAAVLLNGLGVVALLVQGYIGRGLVLRHYLGVDKDYVAQRPPEDVGASAVERARAAQDRRRDADRLSTRRGGGP